MIINIFKASNPNPFQIINPIMERNNPKVSDVAAVCILFNTNLKRNIPKTAAAMVKSPQTMKKAARIKKEN